MANPGDLWIRYSPGSCTFSMINFSLCIKYMIYILCISSTDHIFHNLAGPRPVVNVLNLSINQILYVLFSHSKNHKKHISKQEIDALTRV